MSLTTKKYVKVEDLKEGYLYYIMDKNVSYGIWFANEGGFVTRRTKLDKVVLYTKPHWDLSDNFGAVKPIVSLERSPFTMEDVRYDKASVLEWLRDRSSRWGEYV